MRPLPPNWYRFDNLKRTGGQHLFEVPQSLRERSGKLIYFSMGSMGGADVKLMERLINILSKSPHRFIVSKGPLHEQIELSDNMWGKQSVPQIEILPIVDLVITHGGNNTITETFYFGKPMIVMPLFGDQYDNAQRVDEKGFGIRLDPYKCNEHEFLESIDKLLNDQNLKLEMKRISNRIQSENSISKISELVENLFENI
jgi:UDP:flavonoid glycosyltransferase YjiC (YdhE family)